MYGPEFLHRHKLFENRMGEIEMYWSRTAYSHRSIRLHAPMHTTVSTSGASRLPTFPWDYP
jgi:hypothetical protein